MNSNTVPRDVTFKYTSNPARYKRIRATKQHQEACRKAGYCGKVLGVWWDTQEQMRIIVCDTSRSPL